MKEKLYNGKITIDFNEDLHRFTDEKGNNIIGVTSITSLLDKSRPLVLWAIGLAKDYLINILNKGKSIGMDEIQYASEQHQIKKEKAGGIGDQVHDYIKTWIRNQKLTMPEDEKVRNGVIGFLTWVKSEKLKFINAEKICYSIKYNYAGWFDWEAIDKDDDNCLVIGDNKSSKRIYNEMRYQLALYWNAREEETGTKFKKGMICRFDKETGEFNKDKDRLVITRSEYKKDLKAALGLLETKRREIELSRN